MKTLLLILVLFISLQYGFAQPSSPPLPFGRLTTEISVGSRLVSLMGSPNVQLSNLLQYKIRRKINIVANTTLSYQFGLSNIVDVQQHYSYSISQQVGIGTSFYTKKGSTNFYFLAGLKFDAYSGTLKNDQLPEKITANTSSYTPAYGLMYNVKKGRGKYFFSGSFYIPLQTGVAGIIENANLVVGLGIRIR